MSSFSVTGVLEALRAQAQRGPGGGRALMLIGAQRGQGVTRTAAAVAHAVSVGSVYAIDLDLRRNGLARALRETAAFGPRIDGVLAGSNFYTVVDAAGRASAGGASSYAFHRLGQSRIYAGVFDARALPKGGRVLLSAASGFWDAARSGATVIVDAPSLEHSRAALRVARHMDGVVLVVGDAPGSAPAAMAAKAALEEAGANLIGLVYAGASSPLPALDRVVRRAS